MRWRKGGPTAPQMQDASIADAKGKPMNHPATGDRFPADPVADGAGRDGNCAYFLKSPAPIAVEPPGSGSQPDAPPEGECIVQSITVPHTCRS